MEGREPTWDIISTQAVAGNWELGKQRKHVRNVLPGMYDMLLYLFIDYLKNVHTRYHVLNIYFCGL